jgi:hypothetical protein
MENLRRKVRDTRATVSEEGILVVRTKLHPPLLREDVVARWRLLDWLKEALHSHRLVLISALDGYRKIKPLAMLVHDLLGHDAAHIPNDPLDPDPVFAWLSELIDRLEQGELSEQLAADGGYAGCGEASSIKRMVGSQDVVNLDRERSGARVEGLGHPESVVPSGHRLVRADNGGPSPRIARRRLMGFRRRCMGRFGVVRSFDAVRSGASLDRASGAPGPRALFGTGWSYHRCPSSSLGRPAGSGTQPDPLE